MKAHSFPLTTIDGEKVFLHDFPNKWILLVFLRHLE